MSMFEHAAPSLSTKINGYPARFNGVEDLAVDTSVQLLWDRLSYYGVFLGAAAYGLNVAIFAVTFYFLRRWEKRFWIDFIWTPYVVALFVATTVGNAVHLEFTQEVFIGHRSYPGGPSVYYAVGSTKYMGPIHLVVYAITLSLQDGLLVRHQIILLDPLVSECHKLYRCWIIYGKRLSALVLPGLLFLAALGSAVTSITLLFHFGESFWSHTRAILALGLGSLSCTILLTAAIVCRLLVLRHGVRHILASSKVPYVPLSGIFVESAFIYTAGTISFLVAYYVDSPVQSLLFPIALQAQVPLTRLFVIAGVSYLVTSLPERYPSTRKY
ncbi:hypothetical protein AURDEDRAFT_151565 [Auricularia subglabra TFB-10046 SS5]|nr:hypothetical protein AURDEDRAFT_151565 [Auricularia subglabra TFB-10046 SS5]